MNIKKYLKHKSEKYTHQNSNNRPFEPKHYTDETLDNDALDKEGKNRVKLKVIRIYFILNAP